MSTSPHGPEPPSEPRRSSSSLPAESLPACGETLPLDTLVVVTSLLNNGALALGQRLTLAMRALADQTRADAGALFVVDEERNELVVHGAVGAYSERLEGRRFACGEGLAGWIVAQGTALLLEDAAADPRFDNALDLDTGLRTGSVLGVPLKVRTRTIGALLLLRREGAGSFDAEDRTVARAACHPAAMAVDSANLAAALDLARSELERLDRNKAQFLDLVSHELRTPLTLVQAQLDLLEDEVRSGHQVSLSESLGGMRRAFSRLEQLTGAVLNAVLLEQGALPFSFAPQDIGGLLEEVGASMAALAWRRRIAVQVEPLREPIVAWIDLDRMQQALAELVLNAIRFTPDGGRIVIDASQRSGKLLLRVSDSGVGIPESERRRVFEPLLELGQAEHHHSGEAGFRSGGLGLGLSLVRRIVQTHRGRVWVEGEEGEGSQFFVELPLQGPA